MKEVERIDERISLVLGGEETCPFKSKIQIIEQDKKNLQSLVEKERKSSMQ
jgi:hypothetical protein